MRINQDLIIDAYQKVAETEPNSDARAMIIKKAERHFSDIVASMITARESAIRSGDNKSKLIFEGSLLMLYAIGSSVEESSNIITF